MRLSPVCATAAVLLLAACGRSGAPAGKTAAELTAQLPVPYNAGDVAAGKQVFAQCAACHTLPEGGPNMVGPNLYGIFGAKAGAKPDFAYSEQLKATGWTWDAARIDGWISGPQAHVPGTKMTFVGLPDAKQRRDLIAYLKVATSGGPL